MKKKTKKKAAELTHRAQSRAGNDIDRSRDEIIEDHARNSQIRSQTHAKPRKPESLCPNFL